MSSLTLGEISALGASFLWSISPMLFTIAVQRVGAQVVNRARLLVATFLVLSAHLIFVGQVFPFGAEPYRFFWLGLSAIVGFVIGDGLFFQGLLMIGTRLAVLLSSLAPVFSATLAWIFLGERLGALELAGILVAMSGVAWVALEGRGTVVDRGGQPRRYLLGVLCALGSALLAGAYFVTAKRGLGGNFPAISAAALSMPPALAALWAGAAVQGQVKQTVCALRTERRALLLICCATFIGPLVGYWLSLVALQSMPVGIASTLMSLNPIFTLPVVRLAFGERITRRAVLGTLIAVGGVTLLIMA